MNLAFKQRGSMPLSEFAPPGKRKYPVNDRGHAIAAKGRAAQQLKSGNLTSKEAAMIVAKANRKLGE